jgi:hypothetical protein
MLWVCVCVCVYVCVHIVFCGLPGSTEFFPHYLIKGRIFGKKLLHIKRAFRVSLQLLSEIFFILRIWSKMFIGVCVTYRLFLSDFNEIWICPTVFWKILKYQYSWKYVQWEPSCSMWSDGRIDMTKLIATFRNLSNTPFESSVLKHTSVKRPLF